MKLTSVWGFGNCGPLQLLASDEISVITSFLTCKDPSAGGEWKFPAQNDYTKNEDPIYSVDRSPASRDTTPPPWARTTGSRDAPIDMRDAPSLATTENYRRTRSLLDIRHDIELQQRERRTRQEDLDDNNSITEESSTHDDESHRIRSTLPVKSAYNATIRESSLRVKSSPRMSNSLFMEVELRKVFENDEFVTFRKCYTGKSTTPFSTNGNEEDDLQSRTSSHHVLVVTKRKHYR